MAQEIVRRFKLDGTVEQSTVTIPDPPSLLPATFGRDAFEVWFVTKFGSDAKTAAEIKVAWPSP